MGDDDGEERRWTSLRRGGMGPTESSLGSLSLLSSFLGEGESSLRAETIESASPGCVKESSMSAILLVVKGLKINDS